MCRFHREKAIKWQESNLRNLLLLTASRAIGDQITFRWITISCSVKNIKITIGSRINFKFSIGFSLFLIFYSECNAMH